MTFQVVLYTRKNCELCDQARADLVSLQKDIPHELIEVDIDNDPDLKKVYGERVPVVQSGPFTLEAPFNQPKLRMTLGAAKDNQSQRLTYEGEAYERKVYKRQRMSSGDKISYFMSKHYLLVFNIFLLLYAGLPWIAPVLINAGYPQLAKPIYSFYRATCHQLAFRSWFLYGDQAVYPREAAQMEGWITYGEATGNNEENLWEARSYNGELDGQGIEVGYKVPFCQRDVAIWGAMLIFGILFALSGRKIPPLPIVIWFVVGILPLGLDGGTQLISQIGWFSWIPYRESTPLIRTITGILFGFTTAWFGFPVVEETMEETRQLLAGKRARIASKQVAGME
ncbi:MAG: DUF2085 domain-containing protein [Anaerolineales bacterium]|jgi:uncharacterized membrane protein